MTNKVIFKFFRGDTWFGKRLGVALIVFLSLLSPAVCHLEANATEAIALACAGTEGVGSPSPMVAVSDQATVRRQMLASSGSQLRDAGFVRYRCSSVRSMLNDGGWRDIGLDNLIPWGVMAGDFVEFYVPDRVPAEVSVILEFYTQNLCNFHGYFNGVEIGGIVNYGFNSISVDPFLVKRGLNRFHITHIHDSKTCNHILGYTGLSDEGRYICGIIRSHGCEAPILKISTTVVQAIPSRVRAQQRKDSNLVDVYYDLEVPSGEAATISLSFVGDGGNPSAMSVTGDVGGGVYAGKNRHIVWDAGIDWPNKTDELVAIVTGSEASQSARFRVSTEKFAVSDVRCDYFNGEYGHSGQHQTFLSRVPLNLRLEFSGGTKTRPVDHYLVNGARVDGCEHDFDVATLGPGEHLEVVAVDREGEKSKPFIANFDMARVPRLWDYDVRRLPSEHRVEYWSTEFDTMNLWDGLDAYFTLFDMDVDLSFVPSLRFAQSFDSSTGEFREGTDFRGKAGVLKNQVGALRKQRFGKFAGADITAALSGGTVSCWDVGQQRWVESVNEYGIGLSGEFVPLAFRIPQTLNLVYVKGGFQVSGAFTVTKANDAWMTRMDFDPLAALTATVGAGLEGVASPEVYGKGGVIMHATVPGNPNVVSGLGLQCEVGWRCMFLGFERSDHVSATHWIVGGPTKVARVMAQKAPLRLTADSVLSDFVPIARDYLDAQPRKRLQMTASPLTMATTANPFALVEGGYPSPSPALAAEGMKDHLVYLRDNESRSALDRTELVYRSGIGNEWQPAQAVWDDGTADFMPAVGVFEDGRVVAAWVNGRLKAEDSAELADMARGMEIAVGVRDPKTGGWTCQNLTDDTTLDMSPRLVVASAGSAAVAWMRNPGNGIVGTEEAPTDLMMAFYRNGVWSETKAVAAQAGVVTAFDIAYDGSDFCLAYALDEDGDVSTRGDEEIWIVSGTASGWTEPRRLTANETEDARPFVWYANGAVQMVWLSDQKLRTGTLNEEKRGFSSTNLIDSIRPAGEFKVVPKNDKATFVWQCPAEQGHLVSDVASAEYDVTDGRIGPVSRLLATDRLERGISCAVGDDGAFRMAYESVSVSTNDEGRVVYGAVDLNVFRVEAGCDVGLAENACSFAGDELVPDEENVVLVKLENFRNAPIDNVCVRVYWGENGNLHNITIKDVYTNLNAKSSAVVSVPCYLSSGFSDAVFTVVVDPQAVLPDVDRSNNAFTWRPDSRGWNLAFANIRANNVGQDNWIVSVDVANYGCLPLAAGEKVRFWRGGVGRELVGEEAIGLVLPDGGRSGASIEWGLGGQLPTSAREEMWIELVSGKIASPVKIALATSLDSDGDGVSDADADSRSKVPTFVGADVESGVRGGVVEASAEWAVVPDGGDVDETHVFSFGRLADVPDWLGDFEIVISYVWEDRDGIRHEEGCRCSKSEIAGGKPLTIQRRTAAPLTMTLIATTSQSTVTESRLATVVLDDAISKGDGTSTAVQWRFAVKQRDCGLTISPDGDEGLVVTGISDAEAALDKTGKLVIPPEINGSKVTAIGDGAFGYGDVSFVMVPEGLKSIGKFAFLSCTRLRSAVIPASVTNVGDGAFALCGELKAVYYGGDMPVVGEAIYGGGEDASKKVTTYVREGTVGWGGSLTEWCGRPIVLWDDFPDVYGDEKSVVVGGQTWRYCVWKDGSVVLGCEGAKGELVIPSELGGRPVVEIADQALRGDWSDESMNLTGVTLPTSIKRIGKSAFEGRSALRSLVIPEGVSDLVIDQSAFNLCGLTSLCIPEGVVSIGAFAFSGQMDENWNLTFSGELVLPATLRELGYAAFATNLVERVEFKGNLPAPVAPDWMETVSHEDVLFVGFGAKVIYHSTYEASWEDVVNRSTEQFEFERVDDDALGDIVIPDVVTLPRGDVAEAMARFPALAEQAGNDPEKFVLLPSAEGKLDASGNQMHVWQDVVAGTDPTDVDDVFKIVDVRIVDGDVKITWSPDLNEGGTKCLRKYSEYGKRTLDGMGTWTDMKDVPLGEKASYPFRRVTVGLP